MLRPRTVLKPEHGSASNGVFYIDEDLSLISFSSFRQYEVLSEALSEVKAKTSKFAGMAAGASNNLQ